MVCPRNFRKTIQRAQAADTTTGEFVNQ
jgi:hypothetical protein